MAIDFEATINKYAGEDGNIPAGNVAKIASAIASAVGREFVAKDRYNAKLDEITQLENDKQAAEDTQRRSCPASRPRTASCWKKQTSTASAWTPSSVLPFSMA